jgi:stage III sporulation protein AG
LVIAEGAADSAVKASLTKAVEAGLGLPAYKITVLPQRK